MENIVIKKAFLGESSQPIMETLQVSALEEPTLAVAENSMLLESKNTTKSLSNIW